MVRIETSSTFPVDREVGFDYITDPTNWPQFWADLVDIPRLDRATWQKPGDTMRLRMRLAGRVTELQMTLTELSRPVLVRYEAAQPGMPDTAHERHFEPPPGVHVPPGISSLRRTLENLARQLPAPGTRGG